MTVELKEAGQRSIRRDKILGFVRGYGQIGILVALTLVLGVITPSLDLSSGVCGGVLGVVAGLGC